jgi:hypothetical protein
MLPRMAWSGDPRFRMVMVTVHTAGMLFASWMDRAAAESLYRAPVVITLDTLRAAHEHGYVINA